MTNIGLAYKLTDYDFFFNWFISVKHYSNNMIVIIRGTMLVFGG